MPIKLELGINRCQVINDTYPNNLASLASVLKCMVGQNRTLTRTVILADLLEPDLAFPSLYDQVAELLQQQGISRLIGIGQSISTYAPKFQSMDAHFYGDIDALLQSKLLSTIQGSLVVVKGAPGLEMQRIAHQLVQKCHNTVLKVDLDAIAHNLHFFRSKLAHNTKIVVMVKAFTYGSSPCEVAQFLEHCSVDYLAVAYADEGVHLRENGISMPIMVMNPMPTSFNRLLSHQLEPVVYSLALLGALKDFLAAEQNSLAIHLKLETGMHRLGLEAKDMHVLLPILQNTSTIRVVSLLSHLAGADHTQHDQYTHQQAKLFQALAYTIEQALGIHIDKHLLNTAGILHFPAYQFDMVRLGIGLYGVGIDEDTQGRLKIASQLKTTIAQIKEVPAGSTIGYARKGFVATPKKIATLAIGYADGFSKILGNGQGAVWINGQLAPVIGEVCMDMTMVDITHIDAKPGDEAIIFGKEYAIDMVAKAAHTIAYEILTNVSERVKRVYYTS